MPDEKRPEVSYSFLRIPRNSEISGVCSGIAYRLNTPIWPWRLLFALALIVTVVTAIESSAHAIAMIVLLTYPVLIIVVPARTDVPVDFWTRTHQPAPPPAPAPDEE